MGYMLGYFRNVTVGTSYIYERYRLIGLARIYQRMGVLEILFLMFI